MKYEYQDNFETIFILSTVLLFVYEINVYLLKLFTSIYFRLVLSFQSFISIFICRGVIIG